MTGPDLNAVLGPGSSAREAALLRGYGAHALLFYRQNALKDLKGLERVGRDFSAFEAGAPEGGASPEAARLILRGLAKWEPYWGSVRLSPAALADFEAAAELDPSAAWAQLLCGLSLEMRRRYTRAAGHFERAMELSPNWAWPYILRGICRWYQARFEESVLDFKTAGRLLPKSELPLLFLARAKADLRDRSLTADLDRALRLAGPDRFRRGMVLGWRGRARFVLKRTAGALADLRESIRLLPEYDRGWSWLGVSLAELKKWRQAEKLLVRARALNPYYPTTLYPLAEARLCRGNARGAAATLREAAAVDRSGIWVEHRISMSHPNPAARRSVRILDRFLEAAPRTAWALAWRGQTKLLLGDLKGALADLDAAGALVPSDPWTHLWRGEAFRRLGNPAAALPEFSAARKGNLSYAWAGAGACLLALGREKAALSSLDRSLRLQEFCGEALAWRGEARARLGRWRDAFRDFEAAAQLRIHSPWLQWRLAGTAARLGRWERAARACGDLLAREGGNSDRVWAMTAWVLRALGDRAGSSRAAAHALARNPDQPLARAVRRGERPGPGEAERLAGPGGGFSADDLLEPAAR